MATVHPSSILRAPDEGERRRQGAEFVRDLKKLAGLLTANSRRRNAAA